MAYNISQPGNPVPEKIVVQKCAGYQKRYRQYVYIYICIYWYAYMYKYSKGKVGYPWESTRDIYQHIPPIYGLYNGFMEQYGVIFWEKLLGYLPKGTQLFPLKYMYYMCKHKYIYIYPTSSNTTLWIKNITHHHIPSSSGTRNLVTGSTPTYQVWKVGKTFVGHLSFGVSVAFIGSSWSFQNPSKIFDIYDSWSSWTLQLFKFLE